MPKFLFVLTQGDDEMLFLSELAYTEKEFRAMVYAAVEECAREEYAQTHRDSAPDPSLSELRTLALEVTIEQVATFLTTYRDFEPVFVGVEGVEVPKELDLL